MSLSNTSVQLLYVGSESHYRETLTRLSAQFEPLSVCAEEYPSDSCEYFERGYTNIDCIVSEYQFDEFDGIEFLKQIRQRFPELPFILYTNAGDEEVAREAISYDVTAYIEKHRDKEHIDSLGETVLDAVEQYRSTVSTKQAQTRLNEIARSSTDCLWIFNQGWDELLFISGYEEVWNRSPEAIKENPRDFINGIHPDDRSFVQQKMAEMSDGSSIDIEYRIIKGDSETGWVWVKGEPTSDEAGNIERLIGFTRDITEQKDRERQLRETKKQYEAVIEQSNDGIRIVQDGTIMFVNERFAKMAGCSKEELIGTPADDIIVPADKDIINRHHISRTSGEDTPTRYDVEIQSKTDEHRTVELSVTTIQYQGRPASLSVIRDITERKQRENELRRNERRFEALFNDPNNLVGLLAPDGTVLNINETALSYADLDLTEMVGTPFSKTPWFTGDPELQRQVQEGIQRTAAGEYVEFEWDLTQATGTPLIVEGVFRPVTDDKGDVTSLLISDRDITEERERERKLELRDRAINEAPVGIVMTDPDQEDNPITYANKGFRSITQYSQQSALGRNCRFLQGPLTEEESRSTLRDAIDNQKPVTQDILNYRKDGTPFWNNIEITPIFNASGELMKYIGFQQDITTRVEQERRTELLQQILRHNIRNELNVILGNLSLIAEQANTDHEAVRSAQQAATQLFELSESARRIESQLKEASFEPKQIDLEPLLHNEISTVLDTYTAGTIETAIESGISVLAPNPISIAIRELLNNALKHTVDNSTPVTVSTETDTLELPPEKTKRDVVTIHIEDQNAPISELELARLLGEDESPTHHGTGLGLWLVHWMVTMSGGLISYERTGRLGNKISITLLREQSEVGEI